MLIKLLFKKYFTLGWNHNDKENYLRSSEHEQMDDAEQVIWCDSNQFRNNTYIQLHFICIYN
jgi:hypothetical protein